MLQMLSQGISRRDQRLRDMARALPTRESLLATPRQRLDRAADRLGPSLTAGVQRRRVRLSEVSGSLRPATLRRQMEEHSRGLAKAEARLSPALQRLVSRRREQLDAQMRRFRPETLSAENDRQRRRLAEVTARLSAAGTRQITRWQGQIEAQGRVLSTLGYEATLERGFAVVRSEGALVTTAKTAKKATTLEIQFADGRMEVGGKASAPARKAGGKPTDEQGSLF
jgi:exodeoxyribonuclease VII large subunit